MASVLNLDFETRSAAPLPKVGAHVYAQDPTTTILCAAYAFDDGPVKLWLPGEEFPSDMREHVEAGKPIHAYNCAFERLIWWHVAERLYGWPHATLEQFWDTAAAAAACALPRPLGQAAEALGTSHQKDNLGYQVMMKLSKARGFEEDGTPIWYEDPVKFEHLCRYCMADVEAERAIAKRIPKLGAAEREVFLLDQRINERGVMIDLPLARAAAKIAEKETAEYQRKVAAITKGIVTKPTQVARMKAWLSDQGVEMETLGSKAVAGTLKDNPELPPHVVEALSNRLEAAKSSLGKLQSMQMVAGEGSRARGLFMYHGASPGRWSGKLLQPQNMPRGIEMPEGWEDVVIPCILAFDAGTIQALFGPVLDVLSSSLRAMITAEEGKKFVAADFAAVEARGVAWLAGCQKLVNQFENEEDVYCYTASGIFEKPVNKSMKFERFVGKQCISAGTRVLTDCGPVPIEDVQLHHRLWDGVEWVEHEGLITKGRKETLNLCGLWLTPDHNVWCGTQWKQASYLLHEEGFPFLRSALVAATLPLSDMSSASEGAYKPLLFDVTVGAQTTLSTAVISANSDRPDATNAPRKPQLKNSFGATLKLFLMTGIAQGYSIGCHLLLAGATTLRALLTTTTERAEFLFSTNGATTELHFSDTSKLAPAGTTPASIWIDGTTTGGTNRATSGLLPNTRTPRTNGRSTNWSGESRSWRNVYDLANAGPRHRFTVLTEGGSPLIVSNCTLGSGYGLGWRKFIVFCESFGIKIDEELAQKSISWFREAYSEIPKLWKDLEKASIEAVRSPGVITEVAGGKIKFRVKGEFLWMVLPSGRPLAYYAPELEDVVTPWGTPASKLTFKAVNPKTKKWDRQTTWGGTLVENCVQGMCRDLLVHGMQNAEAAGFEIVLHAHDEAVAEVPEDFGSVEEFEELLCRKPAWAEGFPLAAEGWQGPRYKK